VDINMKSLFRKLREWKWLILWFINIQIFFNIPVYIADSWLSLSMMVMSGLLALLSVYKINSDHTK